MTIDEVRAKVQKMLIEILGSADVNKDGNFRITNNSTGGFVSVGEFGDQFVVKMWAYLVSDVPASAELFEWIARDGQDYVFGSAGFYPNNEDKGAKGTVYFKHNLLADFLDLDELKVAVFALFLTADTLDNELQDRFGGELTNA